MPAGNYYSQQQAGGIQAPQAGGGMMTGIQQQMQSRLANQRGMVSQVSPGLQAGEQQYGIQSGRAAPGAQMAGGAAGPTSSLNNMALQLARNYGLPVGSSGQLVDEYGNITYMPQSSEEMIKLQMISDAIQNRQSQEAHTRGVAAATAGMGLVRERGRGSLAAMQSGMYQNLANLYANQEFSQADYSLMIQEEHIKRAERIQYEAQKEAKKARKWGAIGSLVGGVAGFLIGGPAGAMAGAGVGGQSGQLAAMF